MKKHTGEVTGVRQHHRGKHVVIDVAHGKRSRKKKGKDAAMFGDHDDRPSSSMLVPKAHAHKFPVGKRVSIAMTPEATADGDQGETLSEMGARLRKAQRS